MSPKKKIIYSRSCNYLGIEYGYLIGIGWVHCSSQLPLKPEKFKTMREYEDFIAELEFAVKIQE